MAASFFYLCCHMHQSSLSAKQQLFFDHSAQTNPEPIALVVESAQGCELFDENGNSYIDLISGISVSALGHQHPSVKKAIHQQIDKHMHIMVYGEVVQSAPVEYAHWLTQQLPANLNSVYFVNSGSEAIDAAMKLAKRFTSNSAFVAQDQAYHGSGQGPLSLMNDAYFTQAYRPLLNNVYYIKQNDIVALDGLPKTGVAAVFLELIQSERGAKVASPEYILAVKDYCSRSGALLIVDEIQTGLYRTGIPFEFLRYGIEPDILVLGKSLGGGMPLGCIITSPKIMNAFTQNPILGHITTFGGHPVCTAAGLASSKFIFENHLQLNILKKGQLFKELLKHKAIVSVEGQGLLLACHLHVSINIIEFNKALLRSGVFTDWFLFTMNAIRIAPPLIITEEQINQVCSTILGQLDVFFGG